MVELRNALTPYGVSNFESARIFQVVDKSLLNGPNLTVYVIYLKSEILKIIHRRYYIR